MKSTVFTFISVIFLALFCFSAPSLASGTASEGDVFEGIEEIGIQVGHIDEGFGFSSDEFRSHIYRQLKSRLPLLKVSSISYPYLDLHIFCSKDTVIPAACIIEIDLRRIVYLHDKTTFVGASVWSREQILQGNITTEAVKEEIDIILHVFQSNYLKAQRRSLQKNK